jgi:ADP-ribosylglycohydrolase
MRVSPIGFWFNDESTVLQEAMLSANPTHNHPEGIKGAQSVALAIFMLRNGATKEEVKERVARQFDYDLNRTLAQIRPNYGWKVSCQESVPESFIAFFESHDFPSAIQNAISLGGDTDTMGAIAGSLAQAHYREIPEELKTFAIETIQRQSISDLEKPATDAGSEGYGSSLLWLASMPFEPIKRTNIPFHANDLTVSRMLACFAGKNPGAPSDLKAPVEFLWAKNG